MALKRIRACVLVLIMTIFLASPTAIYSCGPFFEETIFAFREKPDMPFENFASGRLGIVRPTFRSMYLVIAYRYLLGLSLTQEQQTAIVDVWNGRVGTAEGTEDESVRSWVSTRSKVPNVSTISAISPFAPAWTNEYEQFLNCPPAAFENAVSTLNARVAQFGASSQIVRSWVDAQDQVFGNCSGEARVVPAVLDSGDALSRADRAYQIATAQFYAGNFDAAVAGFDAIAADHASPWASIAPYLAARTLIRKASLAKGQSEAFVSARKRLEAIIADRPKGSMKEPAERLLNFIRFRTEPAKLVTELENVLVQKDPGHNFKQDVWDYVLLLSRGEQAGALSDWIKTFQDTASSPRAPLETRPTVAAHALEEWRNSKSLPWLVASLNFSEAGDPGVPELLKAAELVPRSSPGYFTIRHDVIRLKMAAGDQSSARKELDDLLRLPDAEMSQGTRNLFLDQRQTVASTLPDFLQHATEIPAAVGIDMNYGEDIPNDPQSPNGNRAYFTAYSAKVLAKRLPLDLLVAAAASQNLPSYLRREIARTTWVRAVLAGHFPIAMQLQPSLQELDKPLWTTMQGFRDSKNDEDRLFSALLVILNNPGLKPSVISGTLRSTTLGEIDNYRDNWWCADMGAEIGEPNYSRSYAPFDDKANLQYKDLDPDFPFPSFVTDDKKLVLKAEWAKLAEIGTAPNYFVRQTIAYGRAHPDDLRVPQALHLAVRATRFGCVNAETTATSKTAFEFLHSRYPESEWAKKTKYYY